MVCIARVERIVRSVSGNVTPRAISVNTRMARPYEPNVSTFSSTMKLISGVSRNVCQMKPIGIAVPAPAR